MKPTYYLIDFDSTFTQVEAMEELAEISLENDPDKEQITEKIRQLTDMAMNGEMPFSKSLKARIALLSAKRYHLQMLVNRLRKKVSTSVMRNKQFFKENQGRIFIISGGFREFIVPVVKPYFLSEEQVFANTLVFDRKNNIIGADEENPLAQDQGKVKLLKQLKLQGRVVVIGDGYTDYELFASGLADKFYAYTENVWREKVLQHAEHIAPSLDEILFTENQPMSLSYPKTRLKVLLYGEKTHLAEGQFRKEGYRIDKLPLKAAATKVKAALKDAHVLLFEPEANLSALQAKANKLLTAAVWGEMPDGGVLGTQYAANGVVLFGNQYAHTRGLSELALLHLLTLHRVLGEELPGKRLGIVGYGNCGSLLSVLGSSMGMEVSYYDTEDRPPLANARREKDLLHLLRKSDAVVLTTGRRFGEGVILGARELKHLRENSVLVSLGRDGSVDLETVAALLNTGKLGAFGMDRVSRNTGKALEGNPQVMITENLRLNTRQTQENMATLLSEKLLGFVNTGTTLGALNMPSLALPEQHQCHRFVHLHENRPGVLAAINGLLARYAINISGQYLKTSDAIGYVITDVNKGYDEHILQEMKEISGTVRFRVLY